MIDDADRDKGHSSGEQLSGRVEQAGLTLAFLVPFLGMLPTMLSFEELEETCDMCVLEPHELNDKNA
jgi:hypothetical protein